MNNESFYMHPRYDEFTAFLKALETDAKITPSTKHLAFDVWSKTMTELCGERWLETGSTFMSDKEQIEKLKADLDRLHRERDSFQQQSSAMASENERLSDELMRIKRNIAIALDYGSVSERGNACLSIDGGNL